MLPRLLLAVSSVAGVLASGACGEGVFKGPKTKSFAVLKVNTTLPTNITTPDGPVAKFPLLSGTIEGQYNGNLAVNLSSVTERVLNSTPEDGEFSVVTSDMVLETADDDENERIFVTLQGLTTYQNNALHGFGSASLMTESKKYNWVNWAPFIVEWQGGFFTGSVEFEFFRLISSGRKDGKPIPALLPPGGA